MRKLLREVSHRVMVFILREQGQQSTVLRVYIYKLNASHRNDFSHHLGGNCFS